MARPRPRAQAALDLWLLLQACPHLARCGHSLAHPKSTDRVLCLCHPRSTVRATRDISPGVEVTINYGAEGDVAQRQQYLQTCFGFSCTCARCQAEQAHEQTTMMTAASARAERRQATARSA